MEITGPQLARLLELDGWTADERRTHGVYFFKYIEGERYPRSTVVPTKNKPLKGPTLGDILGVKQTGLGRTGLQALIDIHGLR